MLFTIGYQKLSVPDLVLLLQRTQISVLVDVRSRPYGRKTEFNRNNLEKVLPSFNIGYVWKGKCLGGLSGKREDCYNEDLSWLEKEAKLLNVCILCMEDEPTECHRYNWIAADLAERGMKATHLRAADAIALGKRAPETVLKQTKLFSRR